MHDPAEATELLMRAIAAYDDLVVLAEEVEDEWGYVQDLATAWRTELERARVAGELGAEPGAARAIERLSEEVGLIGDPHRAIDWLSTFPQAVLLALGADPWADAS